MSKYSFITCDLCASAASDAHHSSGIDELFNWGNVFFFFFCQWGLTDDVTAVISNECLAVNIDELGDELLGELGMRSEAAEGDVLRPLILH